MWTLLAQWLNFHSLTKDFTLQHREQGISSIIKWFFFESVHSTVKYTLPLDPSSEPNASVVCDDDLSGDLLVLCSGFVAYVMYVDGFPASTVDFVVDSVIPGVIVKFVDNVVVAIVDVASVVVDVLGLTGTAAASATALAWSSGVSVIGVVFVVVVVVVVVVVAVVVVVVVDVAAK